MKKSYFEFFMADYFPTLNKKDPVGRAGILNVIGNGPDGKIKENKNVKDLKDAAGEVQDIVLAYGDIAVSGWDKWEIDPITKRRIENLTNVQNDVMQYVDELMKGFQDLGKALYTFDTTQKGNPMHPLGSYSVGGPPDDLESRNWKKYQMYQPISKYLMMML